MMLQIRLSKGASAEIGGGNKSLPVDTVTVACPDHLVLADLPVAKSLGSVTAASHVKTVGRRSRRHLGERVHFCVRCDFPIAIYGRLSPCEHAFCLDCARSDSICYLCDERIHKIQTIKMMEGIFICAAPHCLKSFLKKSDFESHIHGNHANLLQPNAEKDDGNESEVQSAKQSVMSESSVKPPPRPVFSPSIHSQSQDREDRNRRQQSREPSVPRPVMQSRPSPHYGQVQNHPSDQQAESQPPGFERAVPQNRYQHQGDMQGNTPVPEYPSQHPQQPPNFVIPINANPPFPYPPFLPDGVPPFYGAPYEMARPDSVPDNGSEQGSLLGFPPGPAAAGMNYSENFQRPWMMGPNGLPMDPSLGSQRNADASTNSGDSQRVAFLQGDYGRNLGGFPMNLRPPPMPDKGMERQGSNVIDPRDGKGVLAAQPSNLPPPPPPPHASHNRGNFYSSDMGHDGQSYG